MSKSYFLSGAGEVFSYLPIPSSKGACLSVNSLVLLTCVYTQDHSRTVPGPAAISSATLKYFKMSNGI